MAFNFPNSPITNQEYIGPNGVTYRYDGIKWNGFSIPSGGSGSSPVIASETQPILPSTGDLWFQPSTKNLSIWDGSGWLYVYASAAESIVYPGDNSEASFTSPGTYTWICPAGVNYVHAVCIGGGGGARNCTSTNYASAGGAGGGLGWKNDIPVVPGQGYTVVVGAGGTSIYSGSVGVTNAGGDSYFISTSIVAGFGGQAGSSTISRIGGNYVGDGGGMGGSSFASQQSERYPSAGGGAGGYTGNGGNAAYFTSTFVLATAGSGGGGGGGGQNNNNLYAGVGAAGGGVGIYGQGTNGAAGTNANGSPTRGGGGSGGVGGTAGVLNGGEYGGGAGSLWNTTTGGNGASGAVRIIWGPNRAFPSTNTGVL